MDIKCFSSCVVFDSVVVSRINFLVSSSSRSSQRQISSFFYIGLRRVSIGLTPRKNPILPFFWELYFSIFRNARFVRSVSIIPPDVLYLDLYLIYERFNSDSSEKMYVNSFSDFTDSLV